jgi:capsular exopolysaccharide synthesis family protein
LQQATLKGQLAEFSAKFGSAYPKLAEMRQNLDAINNSIASAVSKVAERAKNDAEVAKGVERRTRTMYLDLESQANELNNKTTTYTILRQEAEQSRMLYETVLKQLKEERVMSDFNVGNVSIVDPARIPARPAKPNVLFLLAASLAGGLFIGTCGALYRDSVDNKIEELPQVGEFPGTVPLGVLPYNNLNRHHSLPRQLTGSLRNGSSSRPDPVALGRPLESLAALAEPRSPYTEALRSIRTLLMFSRPGTPPKVILVTSSVAGEGKSTLSANLAVLLAQQRRKVLLVDGDLRGPVLHRHLKTSTSVGLSSILTSNSIETESLSYAGSVDSVPGLYLVSGGPLPLYPADLIGSPQMAQVMNIWRTEFDFIVVDSAPLLPVTDSILLSELADLTVLVARYQFTERPWLERACSMLQSSGEKKIAIVLNALDHSAPRYYNYYGGKNDAYYGKSNKA